MSAAHTIAKTHPRFFPGPETGYYKDIWNLLLASDFPAHCDDVPNNCPAVSNAAIALTDNGILPDHDDYPITLNSSDTNMAVNGKNINVSAVPVPAAV